MRISDWSSDVCSSDLLAAAAVAVQAVARSLARARRAGAVAAGDLRAGGAVLHDERRQARHVHPAGAADAGAGGGAVPGRIARAPRRARRSEEHTSELQSLMRISYAVFCLKKKKNTRSYRLERIQLIVCRTYHKQC